VAAIAVLAPAIAARAETPAADAREPERRTIRLVVAGSDEDAAALEGSLRELLARIGVRIETSRADRLDLDTPSSLAQKSPSALATAWVDLRSPARATTVLVDGRSGRISVHRDVQRDRSGAIVVEEVAHIVHASVEEIAEAEHARAIEPPPAPAPAAETTVERGAPSPPTWGLDGGAFFAGRSFGRDASVVIGGGGMVGASLGRGAWRPALWLTGTYHVPFDVQGPLVSVHMKALALRIAPTLKIAGGDGWMLEAGPEAGIDALWTTPRSTELPGGRLAASDTAVSPVIGALVAAHVALGARADLVVAAVGDVDLAPRRYVVREGPDSEAVFAPIRFRPAIMAGFTFTMAGASAYPAREGAP
jgi:hypothetical protein